MFVFVLCVYCLEAWLIRDAGPDAVGIVGITHTLTVELLSNIYITNLIRMHTSHIYLTGLALLTVAYDQLFSCVPWSLN